MTRRYGGVTQWMIARSARFMLIYVVLVGALGYALWRLPSGFLPVDDQGFFMVDLLAPSDASFNRTLDVVKVVEKQLAETPGIDTVTFVTGYSFYGQGAMTAQAFVTLRDWSERGGERERRRPDRTQRCGIRQAARRQGLGGRAAAHHQSRHHQRDSASGCRTAPSAAMTALIAAKDQLLAAAGRSPVLQNVVVEGLPPAPQIRLEIDREKAAAHGVTFADINATLSAQLGSSYVNDFLNRGRMQRVVIQAAEENRLQPDDLLTYSVRNAGGAMVPFSSFARVVWTTGPTQIIGFNGYPAVRITGEPAPGFTSGQAIAEMERLAGALPRGFGYEWTGQSLQEKIAGSQASPARAVGAAGIPVPRRALRELVDAVRRHAGGAARDRRLGRSRAGCAGCRTTSISPSG